MAEIDKSLPNVKQLINIPNPEELQVELQEEQKRTRSTYRRSTKTRMAVLI